MLQDAVLEQRRVRVAAIRTAAIDTLSFDLVAADRRPLKPFPPGAHIDVHVPNGLVRQYSLCGDPRDTSRYTIAVKRELAGRGGSRSMHEDVEEGTPLGILDPRNHFPLAQDAAHSLFIAGGIGITPICAMIRNLHAEGRSWELHYCARSAAHAAFYPELVALGDKRVTPWFSEQPLLDPRTLLREVSPGTHVYCCGPSGLMTAVKDAAYHWPQDHIHFEYFAAPAHTEAPNRAFMVELRKSGLVFEVAPECTLLQAVREHGIDVASSCEEGVCGTCETRVLEGECQHRDVLLSEAERAANTSMMICVSRAMSPRIVLDL
ncbi:MAG TPA: PDR/VanB family oxidoreductase [Burkholderiales bacterium]|nr:PDR/VanB family oxidoreductase [Burkholderiales bacterium]